MKKIAARLLVLVILVGVVAGGYYLIQQIPQETEDFPLAAVRRGDLVVKTHLRGELQAVRTLSLTAPNLGSATQITQLAPAGALSSTGNLIMEFDDSERQAALEDAQLEVDRINEQLKKAQADLEIRKSQDDVELLKARFAVRRAELEVKKNELISAIDARKNILTLEEAKRREEKLEQDIKSRLQQREAELAVLREERRKAQIDVDREKRRIDQSRVLSPMSGLVSILQNRAGGRGGFGQTTPDIQEGDQIPPGMEVAKILDLSEMELLAKVEELERANLHEGQEAIVRLDALPGKEVKAKVKRLGNTASLNVFAGEATKKFDAVLSIDMRQLLTHVGAKPEQVERILAKSRENALRTQSASRRGRGGGESAGGGAGFGGGRPGVRSGPGGPGPGGFGGFSRSGQGGRGGPGDPGQSAGFGGAPGGPGGREQSGEARRQRRGAGPGGFGGSGQGGRGGQGGFGGGGQPSDEQRQQMRQRMQQLLGGRDIQSLSQEERQKIFQQLRGGGAGGGQRGGAGGRGEGGFGRGRQGGQGGESRRGPGEGQFRGGPGGRGQIGEFRGGPGGEAQGGREGGRGQRAGAGQSGQGGPRTGARGQRQRGGEAQQGAGEARGQGRRGGQGGARGGQAGGRGGQGGGQFSEQDRQRARQRMQQLLGGRDIQSLSQEERQRIFQQMRQSSGGGGAGGPGDSGRGGFGGPGGAGGRGGGASGFGAPAGGNRGSATAQRFTKEQRENAQLPQPPTEGSDVDVLLRPGLLADAEIIVDKIEDTLYVPFQGIFEVSGNPVVYVWDGNNLDTRRVELGKRSESQIAILSGLEEGELIALEPPDADARRSRAKKKIASRGAQPSFPGAGGPPGAGGGRPGGGGRQGRGGGGR